MASKKILGVIAGLAVLVIYFQVKLFGIIDQFRTPPFQSIRNSVVYIETKEAAGSGFFVNQEGLVVTASHVILTSSNTLSTDIYAWVYGRTRPIRLEVVAVDIPDDIAVLRPKSKAFSTQNYLNLKESESMHPGDAVWVLGHPSGVYWNVYEGIISGFMYEPRGILMVKRSANPIMAMDYQYFLMTTAWINHGSSGAPLIDRDGDVVGMVDAFKAVADVEVPTHQNMCIPGTEILRLLSMLHPYRGGKN